MTNLFICLLFAITLTSCFSEVDPSYPYRIAGSSGESFIITHENLGDSLSIGKITRRDGYLGKSIVNEFTGFEKGPLFVAYEPSGAVSVALSQAKSWISVPTFAGIASSNSPQETIDKHGIRHVTNTISRCVRSAEDSMVNAMTILISNRTSFNERGEEIDLQTWTDTLWWSQDFGLFEEISLHFFETELINWRWRCQSTMIRIKVI